jgi:hypothetical protein
VDVHDGVPLLVAHLLDDIVPGVAGVVDDDVEPAELFRRDVHDALAEVLGRHVAVAGDRPATQPLDQRDRLLRRPLVEVVHHHRGAVAREPQRDFSPNASA